MKPIFLIPACAALILTCACEKNKRPDDNSAEGLSKLLKSDTWRITRYVKGNTDKTAQFDGFRFSFRSEILTANSKNGNYMGSWSVSDHNVMNNEGFQDLDFRISFSTPAYFEELSRDWDIRDKSRDMISLIDVGWEGEGVDYLVLGRE